MRRLTTRAPGSCGEWIQGIYRGRPCLVSCPIDLYARVTITDAPQRIELPPKAMDLIDYFLWRYGLSEKVIRRLNIELDSEIPRGKGMASSTADLAALAGALSAFFDMHLDASEIAELCIAVEPSDNIMFPTLNLFNFVDGGVLKTFRHNLQAAIFVIDFKGTVDTVGFKGQRQIYTARDQAKFAGIFETFQRGLGRRNLQTVGNATTKSALLNQKVLEKPYLPLLIDLSSRFGGQGVVIGHSGTVVGILHEPGRLARDDLMRELLKHISADEIESTFERRVVPGGVQLLRNEF